MKLVIVAALAAAVVGTAPPARACLWDNDTLAEESLTDRDVAKIIGGEFGAHSRGFYVAKIAYTRPMIDAGTAPRERYDDLAVALAKTGAYDDALAVLDAKEQKFPGEYTTLSNRGTFLAMKGDVAGGLEKLRAALVMNPTAHFGREEFQLRLLEYKLAVAKDPSLRTRATFLVTVDDRVMHHHLTKHANDRELDRAIVAIGGMIRFGAASGDADVWFGLAWALVLRGDNQLAVLAFRRAEQLGHPAARDHGALRSTTLRKLNPPTPCCPPLGDMRSLETWELAIVKADRAMAKGAAKDARRLAAEDKLVARKRWRQAFKY